MNTVDSLKTEKPLLPKEFTVTYAGFFRAALIYLSLPVLIFFLGYLKPLWATIFGIGLIVPVTLCLLDNKKRKEDRCTLAAESISVKPSFVIFVSLALLVLLVLSGIGEFVFTSEDHRVRYAILNDLVHYKWPVVYDYSTQTNPAVIAQLGNGHGALTYYLVFWMVPALVGKMFGLLAARIALVIWSAIGMFLVTIGVSLMYKRASKMLFVALMLFAGFDVIPYAINVITGTATTWEGWTSHLFIHGNYFQLMNVFNQSIPGWLITILLVTSGNVRSMGLLGGLMFCYSPWATIGLLPLCICKFVMSYRQKETLKNFLKNFITPMNLIVPIICLICFGALYTSNPSATGENGLIWNFYDSPLKLIKDYLFYVIFEFGIWVLLIYKKHKKDPLFWTSLLTLLILPVYKMTEANDFLMRGSLAPMFLISIYVVMHITDCFEMCRDNSTPRRKAIEGRVVLALLMVASYTTFNHVLTIPLVTYRMYSGDEQYIDEKDSIGSFGDFHDETLMWVFELYVNDMEDSAFFKYFAG